MTPLDSVITRMVAFPQRTFRRQGAKCALFYRNKNKMLILLTVLLIVLVFRILTSINSNKSSSTADLTQDNLVIGHKIANRLGANHFEKLKAKILANDKVSTKIDGAEGDDDLSNKLNTSDLEAIKIKIMMEEKIANEVKPSDGEELVLLPEDFAARFDAHCLDGSPPGFHIRIGKSWLNWILYIADGPICSHVEDCVTQTTTQFGSSHHWNGQQRFEGILSSNIDINPDFHEWSMVHIMSCDGGLVLGYRDDLIIYRGVTLHMRGALIFRAIIEYLKENHHLGVAHNIILAGSSGGGIAALAHVDQLKFMLKEVINIQAVIDGSFWVDDEEHQISVTLTHAFKLHRMRRASGVLKCDRKTSNEEKWQCISPIHMYSSVDASMYVVNSIHDTQYFERILHSACNLPSCARNVTDGIRRRGAKILNDIKPLLDSIKDNAMIIVTEVGFG